VTTETTRIGTVLAGYRVESLLGRGGMSVVYLAEHIRLGRKVALKVLAPALAQDVSFRERFIRESQRAAELDHPNVIPIYDAGEVEQVEGTGVLYIAMRYVRGSDLKSMILREGPLSVGRTLFILDQAASALDAAHDRDLIHRDVKPANILVAEASDHVYLTDFGVVKHTAASRGMTATGIFVGTVDYSAPEQIEGIPLDRRADVYALGCVLYECLTGRPPFDRDSELAVMHGHLTAPPPRVTEAQPDLPRGLDRVIATALAKSRDDRFPTCPDLIEAARAAVLQRQAKRVETVEREPAPTPRATDTPAAAPSPMAAELSPPAARPEPEPVASAAAVQPEARARTGRPPVHWLITAALVVVAAIASAGAVLLFTDGDSGAPTRNSGSTRPALTVEDLVANPLFKDCRIQTTPRQGAVETAVCKQSGTPTAFSPDRWEVSIFPNGRRLQRAYAAEQTGIDAVKGGGRCDGVSWGGEGPWAHGPGKPGGRRFCFFDGNDAVIVWTHERLGQPTHGDVLAVAREGGSDHTGLFAWWRFWHHRIGKAA
jgi:serine/threonine protein kinase